LQTFSNKTLNSEYVAQDDESEALRYQKIKDTEGYGEVLTDEDIRMYSIRDMGLPEYEERLP
jgi:predicted DNA binding CopG/RHH family protein